MIKLIERERETRDSIECSELINVYCLDVPVEPLN